MSELTDTHNIQLTDIEIFVLKYILKNLDVDLKLNFFKDGKKISLPNVIGGFVQKLNYLYCPVRYFICLPGLPH